MSETIDDLVCKICNRRNLDEELCFNCKGMRECIRCCGCEQLEEDGAIYCGDCLVLITDCNCLTDK